MSSSLRIPAEMLSSWARSLASRPDLRGAAAIAAEMQALAGKAGADGHAIVARHQLFTWGESLQGLARRAPVGSPAQAIADEIRSILAGREGPPAPPSSPAWRPAPLPEPPAPRAGWTAAPVPAGAPAPAASPGSVRYLGERDLPAAVMNLLREARRELLVVSPWTFGLETLAAELARTSPTATLRIVSRRPEREDETYHRLLRELQRRKADLVMSPYLHTRMIIADGEALLLGAAGLPKPGVDVGREGAVLVGDAAVVAAARQHFDRIHAEARGGT